VPQNQKAPPRNTIRAGDKPLAHRNHPIERPQVAGRIGAERIACGHLDDPVHAKRAEIAPQLAPGNQRTNLAPEPQAWRTDHPSSLRPLAVGVAQRQPGSVVRRLPHRVDQRPQRN
jgi:hypothetical protein